MDIGLHCANGNKWVLDHQGTVPPWLILLLDIQSGLRTLNIASQTIVRTKALQMNWIRFIRLIRMIYRRDTLPDLDFIQSSGLLAVKIGQTYALRVDFLSERTCRHLARLYRQTDHLAPDDFDALLRSSVDPDWRNEFESIDSTPLASASIGQVHRARLRTGQEVVVKLIKQDFEQRFLSDVRSLRKFLRIVLFFYPKLRKVADPLGILETIEEGTVAELDLRKEISGQETLREIYTQNKERFDLDLLRFPRLYPDLSSRTVMVSEFIDGPTVDELLEQKKVDYEFLLDLFHVHGFYVFCIGTFHGDIHPGNIIVRDGKIHFLDTGAISTVSDRMRTGLFSFFEALAEYDYPQCAIALNKMAHQRIEGDAFERFRVRFLDLYAEYTNSTVSQVSLTRKMMETIKLGVNSGMVFEKGMYPIIKSLMYLDGMVLRCNPDAVLVRDMGRFIGDFKHIVYGKGASGS